MRTKAVRTPSKLPELAVAKNQRIKVQQFVKL